MRLVEIFGARPWAKVGSHSEILGSFRGSLNIHEFRGKGAENSQRRGSGGTEPPSSGIPSGIPNVGGSEPPDPLRREFFPTEALKGNPGAQGPKDLGASHQWRMRLAVRDPGCRDPASPTSRALNLRLRPLAVLKVACLLRHSGQVA